MTAPSTRRLSGPGLAGTLALLLLAGCSLPNPFQAYRDTSTGRVLVTDAVLADSDIETYQLEELDWAEFARSSGYTWFPDPESLSEVMDGDDVLPDGVCEFDGQPGGPE